MKKHTHNKGFTLVEIMIVVALIALLAAIAVPSFLRARKRSQATAHRRFLAWTEAGLWRRLHRAVLDRLGEQARIDWSRAVADAASVRAKKGAR